MEIRKSSKTRSGLAALAAVVAGATVLAAAPPPPAGPLPGIIPLSEIHPGMTGYGLTVAKGDLVERFGVEVLGVVPNAQPGRTSIVVRLSGLGLEESGIVAGMSGSPVYLDGRLAGAVASGWGFTKGPIGGVTPIEAMLAAADDGTGDPPASAPAGAGVKAAELLRVLAHPEDERLELLTGMAGRLRLAAPAGGTPLLSPLTAGFPEATLDRRRADLAAFLPASAPTAPGGAPARAAAGAPETPPKLEGGSAITALLVDGDFVLGATGTVTAVLPDGRFLAFGHPFLGLGRLELPVAPAHVVSILPSLYQSFKIAWAGKAAWRLVRDRDSGVTGRVDGAAPMVPVTLRVRAEKADRTFSCRIAPHPRLLPTLLGLATDAALTLADPTPRDKTLRFRVAFQTAAGEIAYEDVAAGSRARDLALLTASVLGSALEDNELGDPKITGVALDLRSEPGEQRTRILSAALATPKVRPGESLVATIRLADRRGAESVRTLRIPVPRQMPEGRAHLVIADGSTASALKFALDPAEPRTLAGLKRLLGELVPTDRLYAAILVPGHASATGTATLTALPPTAATLLAMPADGSESLRADVPGRLVSEQLVPFDHPVSGSARIEIDVERSRF